MEKERIGAKRKFWQKYLLVFISIATVLPATGTQAAEEIILGVATSLTLLEGRESFNAVELAVDEINAKGGVRMGDKRLPVRIESIDLHGARPGVPVSDALGRLEKFIVDKKIHAIVVGPVRSEVLLAGMDRAQDPPFYIERN